LGCVVLEVEVEVIGVEFEDVEVGEVKVVDVE